MQLPPEVFSAVVSYVTTRDLITLSRTSKAFQRAAEPLIYEHVVLRDAQSAFLGCHAITVRDAFRAPYVKRFILYQDNRRMMPRSNLATVPAQFWLSVQHALAKMVNLEYLVVHDPQAAQSWILDHSDIRFQLREANLRLPWDSHTVLFLTGQKKLNALILSTDGKEDVPLCTLPAAALQSLEVFSGPVLVAAELLGCSLTRLQLTVDEETAPILPTVIADVGTIMVTLRKLHIVGMPDHLLMETLQLISTSWHAIHRCLMQLPALEVIEFDITRWEPAPWQETFQRVVLLEFRTYCPSLQQVVFWIAQHRFTWFMRDGEWANMHQMARHHMPPHRAPVPMSRPAASHSSFSSASSLSSATSSWSSSLSHYHNLAHRPDMTQANQPSSSRTPKPVPLPGPSSIASLPSFAHSLSAFPTMTVVTNDMVHYGTRVRTKDASDKLNSALLITRQRQGATAKAKVGAHP
ncbi:hypothetical protein OH76DRAFT_1351669 [Lentinus brumalis]|uniref:F-box domain-containing protein n=1 Tax=Lentinus brumalis TaxID=2498619 RepID=A0A371D891_9APHY|nr:hypothetical protein OH76DRAFT_1351669 [Polyporus brumalis]